MKKFLLRLSFFVFLLILVYLGVMFFFAKFRLNNANMYTEMGITPSFLQCRIAEIKTEKYKNVDILFCGSSGAYRHFDTREFKSRGISTFNLGSSNQTPMQAEVLLKRYLDQISPKLVVYEISPDMLSSDGVESSVELIAADYSGWDYLKMCLAQKSMYSINTLTYGFFYDCLYREDKYQETLEKNQQKYPWNTYIPGGFVERTVEYNTKSHEKVAPEVCKLKDDQLHYLQNCIDLFKERSIKYIFVECPTTRPVYKSYSNHEVFEQTVQKMGTYYNYNTKINLNDSIDFYDRHHLNQIGVKHFNEKFIHDLDSVGLLKLIEK